VTGDPRTPSSRRPERELVRTVAGYLAEQGYRVAVDPDGTDYFDLVARRGEEVGLVEVKVGDSKAVLAQALKRRGWGDWSAVALGSVRAAERLSNRTASTRAAPIGVWSVGPEAVRVHRVHRDRNASQAGLFQRLRQIGQQVPVRGKCNVEALIAVQKILGRSLKGHGFSRAVIAP